MSEAEEIREAEDFYAPWSWSSQRAPLRGKDAPAAGRSPTARHRPMGALGSRAIRPGTIRSGLWPLAPPGNPHPNTSR